MGHWMGRGRRSILGNIERVKHTGSDELPLIKYIE